MINKYQFLTTLIILSFLSFMLGFFWENLKDLGQVQPVDRSTAYTSRPQSLEVLSTSDRAMPECGTWGAIDSEFCYVANTDYIECTTDSDCYIKNGCGGYADPCTEVK